jgi:nucleotide-binding universal stress UspA family protein
MTLEDSQGPLMLCYDGSEADAHRVVEAGVVIACEAGFMAEALVLAADRKTGELIAGTAGELDAPAIVMSQHGLSGVKSALLRSVSREVVRAYHRPVVVV